MGRKYTLVLAPEIEGEEVEPGVVRFEFAARRGFGSRMVAVVLREETSTTIVKINNYDPDHPDGGQYAEVEETTYRGQNLRHATAMILKAWLWVHGDGEPERVEVPMTLLAEDHPELATA